MGYKPTRHTEAHAVRVLPGLHVVIERTVHEVGMHLVVTRRRPVAVAFSRAAAVRVAAAFTQPAVPEPSTPPPGHLGTAP
ncbi:hypothetical protein [Actinomadura violacea]|uniref:Uncharacterized protein n=1 Tax=Actinomadura violacea TaxID=2819934 RepID=A0ABS3RXU2_9ACTN|nr:hypothetical protein [Actinomadura violacea]MBO2461579.1 hypothetical protein [Actinomadura violacea]